MRKFIGAGEADKPPVFFSGMGSFGIRGGFEEKF